MVRSGIRSYFGIVKQQVRESPASWLAFATLLAWMFGLYWSDLFVGRSATVHLDFIQLRALWLAVEATTLLVSFFLMRVFGVRVFAVALGAGALLFAGTVVVLFAPAEASADGLRIGGVALTGIGSALLLSLQGVEFARRGPKPLLVNVALALAVASLLDSVLLFLPDDFQAMAVSLLPALCIVLLVVSLRGRASSGGPERDGASAPVLAWEAVAYGANDPADGPASEKRAAAIRVVVLPLVVGLAYGLMQRLTGDAYTAGPTEVNAATIASFFLSAVFIALAALFFDSRKLIKLVCFAAIPTIGIAFVMLPLFENAREAAQAICIIGFNSFYFMVWALWAGEGGGIALAKRFVLGLFVLVGAESLGSVIGLRVVSAAGDSSSALAVVSLVVVYLLLMAGIFSFDRSGAAVGAASRKRASTELRDASRSEDRSYDEWASRYRLSARETEVFELLARGRNRVYISKELYISDNTTRTHMKNIYRKLGVHSQQELIDLLEGKILGEAPE
ncbi:response regulator transcription factor [Raoultibacter phocaeensis]|uniref:response regulator transcription factor n=1 Tax=Raoultibacter phocaeensis TaxID=2479841 RepID=UPI0015D5E839|nr:helix-turn-helix transcriptional regulator [Raoultibacter phocaeensis]